MIISKYKTNVNTSEQADKIIHLTGIFFHESIISIDLKHPDKILSIESKYDEYHPEIVIDIVTKLGFKCQDISNHPPHIK